MPDVMSKEDVGQKINSNIFDLLSKGKEVINNKEKYRNKVSRPEGPKPISSGWGLINKVLAA